MIKSLLLFASATIGGIYLTSKEGKNARLAIKKRLTNFEPIIKELTHQAQLVINESDEIDSATIRANLSKLGFEAKNVLSSINVESTADEISNAIKVASKKIREAMNEVEDSPKIKRKNKKEK